MPSLRASAGGGGRQEVMKYISGVPAAIGSGHGLPSGLTLKDAASVNHRASLQGGTQRPSPCAHTPGAQVDAEIPPPLTHVRSAAASAAPPRPLTSPSALSGYVLPVARLVSRSLSMSTSTCMGRGKEEGGARGRPLGQAGLADRRAWPARRVRHEKRRRRGAAAASGGGGERRQERRPRGRAAAPRRPS